MAMTISDVEAYILHSLDKIKSLLYTPESMRIMDEARNQDVIMFLGNTRCGKSTVVNYVIGNGLVGNKVRGNMYNITKANNSKGPNIGVASSSTTTIPSCWRSTKLNGLIVDAPGFDDNRGVIQDIANAFYIKEIINNANSIKLVFISDINDIRNDNIGPFIKFLDVVHRTMPHVGGFNKGMTLVFTKDNEELTSQESADLLKEKIIDEIDINLNNRNLVEYFYRNPDKIVNVRMPKAAGPIDENYVFQNLVGTINLTSRFSNLELAPITPSISEKSYIFMQEAHRHLSEMRDFERVLTKIYNEFTTDLQSRMAGRSQNDLQTSKADMIDLDKKVNSIRNFNGSRNEKLQRFNELVPNVSELQSGSDLYVKLKFVSFVDDVLKIKESNIFSVKMDKVLHSMSSTIKQAIANIQNQLQEISADEFNTRIQQLSNENSKFMEEKQREVERLERENRDLMKEIKRKNTTEMILGIIGLGVKLFLLR